MSKEQFQYRYYFEVTCEYIYDMHKDNHKELLYKTFPDMKDAIDYKVKMIEQGKRIRPVFTEKDKEMENILN